MPYYYCISKLQTFFYTTVHFENRSFEYEAEVIESI